MTKVKSKREAINEPPREQRTVHFDTLMDNCHVKKGVGTNISGIQWPGCVPRSHCVRRFWLLCRVFTEQGWSAPQMTTANVMSVIARLPGCAVQAADAVSGYTKE